MIIVDTVTLDGVRRTADGYLTASARVGRTGIQIYGGAEVGRPDMAQVRVYRPEAEVFAKDALSSFAHRPVTIDHPTEAVTAKNWKKHAVGAIGDEVARDGDFVRVPLVLMDEQAIAIVEGGKRELSLGYTTDLKFESGVTPQGEAYDAVQTNIRGNHLAVVAAARGGAQLRIGDQKDRHMNLKTVTVDGIPIEVTDQGATVIATLQQRLSDASAAREKLVADHATAIGAKDKELATRDAEIDKLKATQIDAAKLDKLVADRADIVAKVKKVADSVDPAGKSNSDLRRAAVAAKLGDAAVKDKSDDYVEARFDALVADAGSGGGNDQFRNVVSDRLKTVDTAPAAAAHAAMTTNLQDAWKNKGAA